jgi:proliferating cell nuclear antigen
LLDVQLAKDVNLEFGPNGVRLATLDHAHICLVSVLIRSTGVEAYKCERELVVGIDSHNFFKYLRNCTNHDVLTLRLEGENPDVMSIQIANEDKSTISQADMKLLDLNVESMNVPDAEYDAVITMGSDDFQRICRDMSGISSSLWIRSKAEDQSIEFSCSGDIGTLSYNVSASDSDSGLKILKNGEVNQEFALKNLVTFAKAAALSKQVELYLQKDMPLMVRYEFMQDSELTFMLAPKMSDDDAEMDS